MERIEFLNVKLIFKPFVRESRFIYSRNMLYRFTLNTFLNKQNTKMNTLKYPEVCHPIYMAVIEILIFQQTHSYLLL